MVIVLYGMDFKNVKSLQWLFSSCVSFVQDVFITQPLKVCIINKHMDYKTSMRSIWLHMGRVLLQNEANISLLYHDLENRKPFFMRDTVGSSERARLFLPIRIAITKHDLFHRSQQRTAIVAKNIFYNHIEQLVALG